MSGDAFCRFAFCQLSLARCDHQTKNLKHLWHTRPITAKEHVALKHICEFFNDTIHTPNIDTFEKWLTPADKKYLARRMSLFYEFNDPFSKEEREIYNL